MFWKYIRQKTLIELVALFLGGVGVVLLAAPFHLSATLGYLEGMGAAIVEYLVHNLRHLNPSHAFGLALLIASAAILLNRIRYRLQTQPQLISLKCPACGGELRRSHRRWFDYCINLFVPVFRYRCRDRQCGWRGLRVKSSS